MYFQQRGQRALACTALALFTLACRDGVAQDRGFGAFEADFSSTFNYGIAMRTGDPDRRLVNPTNGGNQNFKDGDLVLHRLTGTHELGFQIGRFDGLVRGTYYYDRVNDRTQLDVIDPVFGPATGRDPNGNTPDSRGVADFRLLDAYVATNIGSATLRLGSQVISWGESTFIGGSLNDINTVDVSNLRTPGAQLKEGLLPTPAFRLQLPLSDSLSLDAFYLFQFDEIQIDPAGVFWDAATFLADGGTKLGPFPRTSDREASDSGQYGASLQFFAPQLGAGWDFGVYYMRVHSHLPYLSFVDRDGSGGVSGADAYFVDYPEGTEIYGASFNTLLGRWAWSGEYSHRRNLPVLLNSSRGVVTNEGGGILRGWDRVEVDQVQTTLNYGFVPRFIKADRVSVLAEAAYQQVRDLPARPTLQQLTDSSAKYQLSVSADFNKAISDVVNLTPKVAFVHDVKGVSPEASAVYLKGRKVLSVGIDWSYLVNWSGGLVYTHSFGADNLLNTNGGLAWTAADRSWIALNINYQLSQKLK